MEKTNVANMHQNIVQTNEQTNAQTNAQTAENNIAQSTELNFNHNAEQNFVQTTEQNMHQNTEPSLKRNAVQSKEQAAEQSTVQNTEPSLKRKSYFLKLVVMTFIVTPLVIQLSQVLVFFISDGGSLFPSTFDLLTITLLASTPGFVATVLMWWRWAKNVRENLVPKSLAMRFFPQLLIFAGGLAIWAIVCYFSGFSYRGDLWWLLLVLDFPYFITIVAEIFMTRPDIYLYIKLVQLIITIIVPSAVFAYRRISFRADRRLLITGGAAAALMAVIGVELWQRSLRFIDNGSALDKEAIVGK
ncbi:MAG: hypothetical protein LBG97_06570 [Coriobacteriales bacterium]|jgi:cation transport ATPase|nr:hypothetical protein [Coriobacteriales bacterium]